MDLGPVRHDVTRRIWGRRDTVVLIFAGASAEFAANRAVDWLFVTGALPRDPIGRMFQTVGYAQGIAFADAAAARESLARIRRAHEAVEGMRGRTIPMWAHRAVLYMLIHYSERAATLLDGPLSASEQEGLHEDFRRIGEGLGIDGLPSDYARWRVARTRSLREDLAYTDKTATLYDAYRRQLGAWRYSVLRQVQAALVPPSVARLLRLPPATAASKAIGAYLALRAVGLDRAAQRVLIPGRHWAVFLELDRDDRAPRLLRGPRDRRPPGPGGPGRHLSPAGTDLQGGLRDPHRPRALRCRRFGTGSRFVSLVRHSRSSL